MAAEKVRASQITDILSHPQAVAQCQNFLRKHIPQAEVHLTYSTADAAKEVAMGWEGEKIPHIVGLKQVKHYRHHFAAIGTRTAASMYKLNIISSGINDYPDNATRFIVVSQKNHPKTGRDKTSIVFSTRKNTPGALYEILAEFALRRINLTKIESRPSKKVLGDYFFYIDFEGHGNDWLVAEALKIILRKTSFFKVLGSYPLAK
jgi:prephenate dehydratase